jgi:hypothetical protein
MTMNIRRSIYWFAALVVVLLAVLLWHGRNTLETPLAAPADTNAAPSVIGRTVAQSINATNKPKSAQAASNVAIAPNPPRSPQPAAPEGKSAQVRDILNANDADIVFYGRLEDQFSNGVAGAEVNFSIQYENASDRGIKRGQVASDGNGFFTISGYTGANLGVMPKKPGYALATTGTSFRYSQISPGFFVPDANNPTVIRMWKLQGAEPLVSINQHYKLHYTGEPINFDLLTGKVVPTGGDVKITVNRAPGVISGRNRLDWSVQVEAVDGGLMDSGGQDRVVYAAPDNGYQPSMTLVFSTTAPNKWAGGFTQGLFLTSRNGQVYSKLGLSFDINDAPDGFMSITFGGAANANGSRNWEGDSNTMQAAGQ